MQVAIQGEAGSFSHEAALTMMPEATILPCAFSAEVFKKVQEQDACAVIPIENSLAGSVTEHFDLLLQHDVQIERESLLRIRHSLIALPGARLEDLRDVFSHPVALAQCRRFLAQHPNLTPMPGYDTAGSVKQLIAAGDPTRAAIASRQAALWYGGEVLASGIEDNPANFTRFFLIRSRRQAQQLPGADKVTIAFTVENRPGTLVSALQVFAANNTNMSKIESRPVPGKPWQYVFYVDYQIAEPDAPPPVLEQLQEKCLLVKELGRYPSAPQVF